MVSNCHEDLFINLCKTDALNLFLSILYGATSGLSRLACCAYLLVNVDCLSNWIIYSSQRISLWISDKNVKKITKLISLVCCSIHILK